MYSFKNDYAEGAHPAILRKLVETNDIQQSGYGEDVYSTEAKALIKEQLGNPEAEVFFLSGGTQTNLIVIAAMLRVHEAVISTKTGHISSNETGAIEATGHKVITIDAVDGKLTPNAIAGIMKEYAMKPHVVKPKMVYISNSTELGTIYQLAELIALSEYCQVNDLYLFMDGARLGHALTASDNDVALEDIGRFTDVFYIGGTKNGALLGEAVVFNKAGMANEFDYVLKQRGALLAKGRLLGIQFLELFGNNLFFSLASHANEMAVKIAKAISSQGYGFMAKPTSNQLFPILPRPVVDTLSEKYEFILWKATDENTVAIRLITSWATHEAIVQEFIMDFIQASISWKNQQK